MQSSSLIDQPLNSNQRYLAISSKKVHKSDGHRRKSSVPKNQNVDKKLSYRDYGDVVNDYSVPNTLNSKINLSSDAKGRRKRADHNIIRLKKLKADKASLERYLEMKGSITTKMPKINGNINYYKPCLDKVRDYHSIMDNLHPVVPVNSSQIILAESKLLVQPTPPSSLGNYKGDKTTSAYTNRPISKLRKDLPKINSISMLKNYYTNKRSKCYYLKIILNNSDKNSLQKY